MVWTLSNLCRGKPQPDIALVRDCIPALAYVISRSTDSSIIVDAAWSLFFLIDGDDDRIEHVVVAIPVLVSILKSVTLPALRTLGTIITGSERQAQMVIDAGFLLNSLKILESPKVCTH
jgi:hypothetical protein